MRLTYIFSLLPVVLCSQGFMDITFSLCGYFVTGGTCEGSCVNEAVHAWGIPLCKGDSVHKSKCCIPYDHPLLKAQRERQKSKTTLPPTTITTTPTPDRGCGMSRAHSRVRRVIGGHNSPPGAWPWQVAIRLYTGQYMCGGVIIDEKWILTAAHCFPSTPDHDVKYIRVYVGDQKLSYGRDGRDKTLPIKRVIQHDGFLRGVVTASINITTGERTTYTRHVHDIALIELENSLTYSDTVQPICMPESEQDGVDDELPSKEYPEDCWVAGWGETGGKEDEPVQKLREVRGRLIQHTECGEKWGTDFEQDVVCFGKSGIGPCKGDSGGGLSCRHGDGRFYLAGIVSWGRDDCSHDNHPSVLSNVAVYKDWIYSYTGQQG